MVLKEAIHKKKCKSICEVVEGSESYCIQSSCSHYNIFSDSQAALSRIQHDRTGPGQAQAKEAIRTTENIIDRNNRIALHWTPAHTGVRGNEVVDAMAKRAAEERKRRAPLPYLREASLAHLTRVTTEKRSAATAEWIRTPCGRR